jgi:hypothetical protein
MLLLHSIIENGPLLYSVDPHHRITSADSEKKNKEAVAGSIPGSVKTKKKKAAPSLPLPLCFFASARLQTIGRRQL